MKTCFSHEKCGILSLKIEIMNVKLLFTAALLLGLIFVGQAQKVTLKCPNLNSETITVDLSAKPTASYLYKSPYDENYVDFRQYYVSYDNTKDMVTIKIVNTNGKKEVTSYTEVLFEKAMLDFSRIQYEPSEMYCLMGLNTRDYNKAITEWLCNVENGKQSTKKESYFPMYFKTKAEAETFVAFIKNLK